MSESGAADAAAVGGIFSLAKFSFRHLRYVSGRIPRAFQHFERIVSGSVAPRITCSQTVLCSCCKKELNHSRRGLNVGARSLPQISVPPRCLQAVVPMDVRNRNQTEYPFKKVPAKFRNVASHHSFFIGVG